MSSPFPGMDPFIESQSWKNFHSRMVNAIADTLEPAVRPRYSINIEDNIYLACESGDLQTRFTPDVTVFQQEGWMDSNDGVVATTAMPALLTIPDVEPIEEHYLVLRAIGRNEAVTVVELLSPTNKSLSDGRNEYLAKRRKLMRSRVNVIEIDLLRSGRRLPTVEPLPSADYFAFVARATQRPQVEVYSWMLADKLPTIPVPLSEGDPDVSLDLQAVFELTYGRAGFSYSLDYKQLVEPPLKDNEAQWLERQLASFTR